MGLSDALLPEFDHEMANTRKTLERVPEDKLGWKPHAKSMSMGQLAGHLSQIPHWVSVTLTGESFDVASPEGAAARPKEPTSRKELLATFDKNVADGRAVLAGAKDEQFFQSWSLLQGGKQIFKMPKAAVLRSFVLNHNVHHRAQLGVYLRLNDVAVPSIYGPSADETGM